MKKMIFTAVGVLALTAMFTTALGATITISGNQSLQGQTGEGELVADNNDNGGNSATAIQLRNGYTLTVEDGAIVNLISGMNISQGVNGDGANITQNAGSTVNIGSSLSMSGNATTGGTSFYTMKAGSTLDINGNMGVGSAFAATFAVEGSGSTIGVGGTVTAFENSTFKFTLDETGVSSIDATGVMTIVSGASLKIDAASYTGGEADITLFSYDSLSDATTFDLTVTGLDVDDYTLTYGADSLVLSVIPEPATIGMLGLGAVALIGFRRRMR